MLDKNQASHREYIYADQLGYFIRDCRSSVRFMVNSATMKSSRRRQS